MRVFFLIGIWFISFPLLAATSGKSASDTTNKMFGQVSSVFLLSYTDFKFDSSNINNFNHYQGQTTLLTAGGDNIQLYPTVMMGLSIIGTKTGVNSAVLLSPSPLSIAQRTIYNDTLFMHISKRFEKKFVLDLSGARGQNHITSVSIQNPYARNRQVMHSHNVNSSGFISVSGLYHNQWKKYLFSVNARMLWNRVYTGSYNIIFEPQGLIVLTLPLTNRVTMVSEGAELGYKYTPTITPFINARLIQVVHFYNSRVVVNSVINGLIPQLNMNKSAYGVGGGASLSGKKLTIRLEEQYYNSAGTFISYQTLLSVKYKFG